MTDPLQPLLDAAGVTDRWLRVDDAVRLWSSVGHRDDSALDDFLALIVREGHPTWTDSAEAPPDDAYALRLGHWKIDLTLAGVRSLVLSSLIAAGMAEQGWGEFGLAFLTAVLPTVVDIERVTLTAKDRMLLADLQLKPRTQVRFYDIDTLYSELPDEARRVVNRYDFAEFVERLRQGGEAELGPFGQIRIRPPRQ